MSLVYCRRVFRKIFPEPEERANRPTYNTTESYGSTRIDENNFRFALKYKEMTDERSRGVQRE